MNFNRYKYIAIAATLTMSLSSCEKFLEKEPDLRTQLNSNEKVAQLLVSAYPKGEYMTFAEQASDNAEDKGPSIEYISHTGTEAMEDAFFWRDDLNGASINGSTDDYWNECYLAIASANTALKYINENPGDASLLPYKGEALVARAYAHFMLVNLYAKTYEIGGTNTSPGVPYVTDPEKIVFEQYDRGTVASTYERIEEDLLEGLPLLKATVYKVPKFHFTPISARAFAARFYLFKGVYSQVVKYATEVYGDLEQFKKNLRPWNTEYYGYPSATFETIFTQSSQNSTLMLCEANSTWARSYYGRYALGQTVVRAMIETPNVTGGTYAYRQFNREPFYSFRKWDELFFESQIGSGFGQPYVMVPLFTVDELLMNRAEAYTSSDQYELALDDINTFISTRVLNYSPSAHNVTLAKAQAFYNTTDPKEALIKTILDMKRVEFVTEGLRWFDLNRHQLTVRHLLLDENRNPSYIELPYNDPRRLFQLPQPVVKAGIEPNPR